MNVYVEPRSKSNECSNPSCKSKTDWVYIMTIGEVTFQLCRPCGRKWRNVWYAARPEFQHKTGALGGP